MTATSARFSPRSASTATVPMAKQAGSPASSLAFRANLPGALSKLPTRWSHKLTHLCADPRHQFVDDRLVVLVLYDAEVIDAHHQQARCTAACLGLFHGVGDAIDRELEVAKTGHGIDKIGRLQLADLFAQQSVGAQQCEAGKVA